MDWLTHGQKYVKGKEEQVIACLCPINHQDLSPKNLQREALYVTWVSWLQILAYKCIPTHCRAPLAPLMSFLLFWPRILWTSSAPITQLLSMLLQPPSWEASLAYLPFHRCIPACWPEGVDFWHCSCMTSQYSFHLGQRKVRAMPSPLLITKAKRMSCISSFLLLDFTAHQVQKPWSLNLSGETQRHGIREGWCTEALGVHLWQWL